MKLKAEIILAELNKVIAMVPSDQGIIIAMRYGGKIVGGKIVFCNVHAHAEMLLETSLR